LVCDDCHWSNDTHEQTGNDYNVRDLNLEAKSYDSLNHFYHSDAWNLGELNDHWIKAVCRFAPLIKVNDAVILTGDGVKVAMEAKRSPGVKRHHQESENSSKGEYIYGHLHGSIGINIGNDKKQFCVPVSTTIQDGVENISLWEGNQQRTASHVVQMINQGHHVSQIIDESSVLTLDRYFLSAPALARLDELNQNCKHKLQVVTKAKKSCVAFEEPLPRPAGTRGRKPKRGERIKLMELFDTKSDQFTTTTVKMYGEEKACRHFTIDLLWGQGLYKKLRFVLVEVDGRRSILVSTDLSMRAESIIEIYGIRFKIESTFREMKQVIGGFGYRFWSKSLEKLNRFSKRDDPSPMDKVTDDDAKRNIIKKVRAIEMYVLCSSIALGLLQILSLKLGVCLGSADLRDLRTYSNEYPSEATMMTYIRNQIYFAFAETASFQVIDLIKSKQNKQQFTISSSHQDDELQTA
jgi:hypothetical protein